MKLCWLDTTNMSNKTNVSKKNNNTFKAINITHDVNTLQASVRHVNMQTAIFPFHFHF